MTPEIKALVALDEGVGQGSIEDALPAAEGIQVLEYVAEANSHSAAFAQSAADLVIVACNAGSAGAISLIAEAVAKQPERPTIVLQLGDADANGFMQAVFAAGADDVIVLPETPERIRHALEKAIARKRGVTFARGGASAPLICIVGPKGGTGKTVVACNLAVAMAEEGRRPVLVDLDLHFGDVGLGLRLTPERTIYDLARAGGTLDAEKLSGFLSTHSSGARVLLAPTRPDHAGAVKPDFVTDVLAVLRSMSGAVIVDTPAGFPPEVISTIDSSTDLCIVGMLDAFSLKDTKLGLETLDHMGYDRSRVRIVLNRADTHVGISQDDIRSILGQSPDILVPSQREIPRSITEGTPIVISQPRSPAAKAFRGLASLYLGPSIKQQESARRRAGERLSLRKA